MKLEIVSILSLALFCVTAFMLGRADMKKQGQREERYYERMQEKKTPLASYRGSRRQRVPKTSESLPLPPRDVRLGNFGKKQEPTICWCSGTPHRKGK